jgi:hypothetical protein
VRHRSAILAVSRANRKLFRIRRLVVESRDLLCPLACVVAKSEWFLPVPSKLPVSSLCSLQSLAKLFRGRNPPKSLLDQQQRGLMIASRQIVANHFGAAVG